MKNLKCVIGALLLTPAVILGLCILVLAIAGLLGVIAYYFSIILGQHLLFPQILYGVGLIFLFIVIWYDLYVRCKRYRKKCRENEGNWGD